MSDIKILREIINETNVKNKIPVGVKQFAYNIDKKTIVKICMILIKKEREVQWLNRKVDHRDDWLDKLNYD